MTDNKNKMPQLILGARPITAELTEMGRRWAELQKASLFVFTSSYANAPRTPTLTRPTVDAVDQVRSEFESVDALDIILDHYGGDVEAAFQLINLFRARCKKLRIFIPDYAKSAATLLTLGADEIWMSDGAEIGPLDAQIPDPRDPDKYISALDEFRAVDYLRTHSFEILNEFSKMIARTTSLSTKDRLQLSIEYTTRLMKPMYATVDPLHFGGSHRAVEMSTECGRRVMSRFSYRDWPTSRIENVLRKLTWDYPSHSFPIDRQECVTLGLHAKRMVGELDDLAHAILSELSDAAGFLAKFDSTEETKATPSSTEGENNGQIINGPAATQPPKTS